MRGPAVLRAIPLRAALCLGLLAPVGAAAHPHVTVVARGAFVLDDSGQLTGIRHSWTFDEAYSAFATTGFKKDWGGKYKQKDLEDLAKINVESLEDFKFFTLLKQGRETLEFDKPLPGYHLEFDGKALVLNFVLPLKKAIRPSRDTTLRVDDESFFVAFSFDKKDAITIEKNPGNCRVEMKLPEKSIDSGAIGNLSEDFFNNLKTGFTLDFVGSAHLKCQ